MQTTQTIFWGANAQVGWDKSKYKAERQYRKRLETGPESYNHIVNSIVLAHSRSPDIH